MPKPPNNDKLARIRADLEKGIAINKAIFDFEFNKVRKDEDDTLMNYIELFSDDLGRAAMNVKNLDPYLSDRLHELFERVLQKHP